MSHIHSSIPTPSPLQFSGNFIRNTVISAGLIAAGMTGLDATNGSDEFNLSEKAGEHNIVHDVAAESQDLATAIREELIKEWDDDKLTFSLLLSIVGMFYGTAAVLGGAGITVTEEYIQANKFKRKFNNALESNDYNGARQLLHKGILGPNAFERSYLISHLNESPLLSDENKAHYFVQSLRDGSDSNYDKARQELRRFLNQNTLFEESNKDLEQLLSLSPGYHTETNYYYDASLKMMMPIDESVRNNYSQAFMALESQLLSEYKPVV